MDTYPSPSTQKPFREELLGCVVTFVPNILVLYMESIIETVSGLNSEGKLFSESSELSVHDTEGL
jgi:hypothetical protein